MLTDHTFYSWTIGRLLHQLAEHVKEDYIKNRYNVSESMHTLQHFVDVQLVKYPVPCGEKEIFDIAAIMREGLKDMRPSSSTPASQVTINNSSFTSIKNIFDILKLVQSNEECKPEVILIEGAPGMGKTTLCKEITYQWAKSQSLVDLKLMFYMSLQNANTERINTLEDFILYFYNFDKTAAKFANQCATILHNRHNHDVLIILDGYEINLDSTKDSFLTKLVGHQVFRQSKIIVTPKCVASSKLQSIANTRIEILGFSDENKIEYIKQEFQNSPDKIEALSSYMNANKHINSICYVPVVMDVFVQMYKETETLPENQIKFYQEITSTIITRHVQRCDKDKGLQCIPLLQDLPELYKTFLMNLSKIAFDCLKSDKTVFTDKDLHMVNPEFPLLNRSVQGLGLLKSTQHQYIESMETSIFHSFVHLLFQKFLAAYYISSQESFNNQLKLLRDNFFDHKYTDVWIMFVSLNEHTFSKLLNYSIYCEACHFSEQLISSIKNHGILHCFSDLIKECINCTQIETFQLFGLKTAETKYYNTLCLKNGVDELSLMNKLALFKIAWNKIYLSLYHNSKADKELIEIFVMDQNMQENLYSRLAEELNNNKDLSVLIINASSLLGYRANRQQLNSGLDMNDSITNLVMRDCFISEDTSVVLSSYIEKSKLHVVIVDECTFSSSGGKSVFSAIGHIATVEIMVIGNMDICEDTAIAVASGIVSNPKLSYLEIVNCNPKKEAAFKIITALKNISKLGTLILNNNGILKELCDDLAAVICVNSNLKKLKLANNYMENYITVIAQALLQVKTLTDLDLSNNNMTDGVADALAVAIETNTSLQRVSLRGNILKTNGMIKIAQSLSWGSNLKMLDIRNNQVTKDAADAIAIAVLSNKNLEELYLDNNSLGTGIKVIAAALKQVSNLTVLSLDNNNATETAADELAAVVQNNKLQKLSLAKNGLKLGAIKIAWALSKITTLITLNLHANEMTKEVAYSLAAAVKSNNSLTTLKLSCNRLETDGVKIITQPFRELKSLQVLHINDNQITEEAAEDIASFILHSSSLKELYLSNNNLQDGMIKIADSLHNASGLRELVLNSCNMTESVAGSLAVALKKLKSLKSFAIMNNKFRQKGIINIMESLSCMSGLTLLNIYNNQITEQAEDVIALAIHNNNKLEEIFLGENDFPGAGKIITALKEVNALKEINLNGCRMTENVAKELEAALANKHSLKVVGLEGNYLKSSGITKISIPLRNISNITLLNLHNNQFTEEAGEALASIILSNTKLEDLYLGSNMLQMGALKVTSALKHISTLKVLDLNDNNMTECIVDDLAAVINCNSSLSDLRLRNNRLKTKGFVTIAKALSKLSTLKSLNVRNNQITKEAADDIVSVLSTNTNMTHLYLGSNNLQEGTVRIVAALNNSTINTLDLDNNNIPNSVTRQLLTGILRNCDGIKTVWCRRNNLFLCDEAYLNQTFSSTITSLDLSDNYMSDAVSDQLAIVIANNKSLESLHLRNNNFNSRGAVKITQTLSTLKTFKSLNLGGNLITDDASDSIASVISNNPEINELYFGNNYLANGVLQIVKALEKISKIKVLHFDNNSINESVAEKLALVFYNSNIEDLNLSYNNLQSTKCILEALSKISSLKSLNLSACCMTDAVAEHLAAIIDSNYSLKTIKFQNNYFNTEGILAIAKSLSRLSTLKILNIRNNVLHTKEAVEAVSLVLENNRTIEQFYYGENMIQNQASKLMGNLKAISTLVTLYLVNVTVKEKDVDNLVAIIENNPLLEEMCLAGSSLMSTGLTKVLTACKINTKNLISLDIQSNSVDPETMAAFPLGIFNLYSLEAVYLGGISLTTVETLFYKMFLYFMQEVREVDDSFKSGTDLGHRRSNSFVYNQDKLMEIYILQVQSHNMSVMSKWNYNDTYVVTFNYGDHVCTNWIDEDFLTQNMLRTEDTDLKLSHINATNLFCFPLIKKLKVIDLEFSNIDEDAAFELAAMLHYNKVLKQLWLKGNKLNAAGALFILNSLENVSTLKVLDLSYNNISYQIANSLAVMMDNNHTLEQLWLDGNKLLNKGVARISAALHKLTTLRILSLSNNNITDEAAEELSTAINACIRLEDLSLGSNNLQTTGICTIAQSLHKLLRLRKLDIFNNKITEGAAEKLANAISNSHSLQELHLSNNMLKSTGTIRILQALKFNRKLQILTLSNNGITSAIVSDLTDVLVNNNMLYVLLISGNDLKTAASLKITETVKAYNTGMQLINLCDNNISSQGKHEIATILSAVTQLKLFV